MRGNVEVLSYIVIRLACELHVRDSVEAIIHVVEVARCDHMEGKDGDSKSGHVSVDAGALLWGEDLPKPNRGIG